MSQVIVFISNSGAVATSYPNPSAVQEFGLQYVAEKSVTSGKPFKIMDASELPSRLDRAAWVVDPADLTDGVGSAADDFQV